MSDGEEKYHKQCASTTPSNSTFGDEAGAAEFNDER
jgi:hypothetical protein